MSTRTWFHVLAIGASMCGAGMFGAGVARAQSVTGYNKPFSMGGALGVSFPVSDLANATNTGYNGTLILGLNTPQFPVGFRIDGGYDNFGFKGTHESVRVVSLSGNAVLNMPTTAELRPYFIGGAGLYHVGTSVSGSGSTNNFGLNGGVGIVMPLSGFNAFAEARYHWIDASGGNQFIPITIGVMF